MSLFDLPTELLTDVLGYLPVKSLLAFGATNVQNHIVALSCLKDLNIGIHPSRKAALLSEANQWCSLEDQRQDNDARTNILLDERQCRSFFLTVYHQNNLATKILQTYGPSLRSLELSLWDLKSETAAALSRASRLQHLTLRMNHPLARVCDMPRNYWLCSPGSPVWNQLYESPRQCYSLTPPTTPGSSRSSSPVPQFSRPVFTKLKTLELERAGITDYQLGKIIAENPDLRELRLRKCLNLTEEFFEDLAKRDRELRARGKKGLRVLHFEMSNNSEIDKRILEHIAQLTDLESLSLAGCSHLKNEEVVAVNEDLWEIDDLTLPHLRSEDVCDIEIDPEYLR